MNGVLVSMPLAVRLCTATPIEKSLLPYPLNLDCSYTLLWLIKGRSDGLPVLNLGLTRHSLHASAYFLGTTKTVWASLPREGRPHGRELSCPNWHHPRPDSASQPPNIWKGQQTDHLVTCVKPPYQKDHPPGLQICCKPPSAGAACPVVTVNWQWMKSLTYGSDVPTGQGCELLFCAFYRTSAVKHSVATC